MLENMMGGASKYYPWSGPGNKKLLTGNRDLGYFGPVTFTELFSFDFPLYFINGTYGKPVVPASEQKWHKFLYKDRVLYIPSRVLTNSIFWNTLYTSGLIYGAKGPGITPAPPNIANTDQLVRILVPENINGVNKDWVVKLQTIQGANQNPMTSFTPGDTEFDDLFYGLFNGKWASLTIENGRYYLTQTRLAGSPGQTITRSEAVNSALIVETKDADARYGWFPVVELVKGPTILTAPRRVDSVPGSLPTPVLTKIEFEGTPLLAPKTIGYSRDSLPVPLVTFDALLPTVTWSSDLRETVDVTVSNNRLVTGIRQAYGSSMSLPEPSPVMESGLPALTWTTPFSQTVQVNSAFTQLVKGVRAAYGSPDTLLPVEVTFTTDSA